MNVSFTRERALSLYRRVLRVHRQVLPAPMRALGDRYVGEEFRRHKDAKPKFLVRFYAEWEDYAKNLEAQAARGSVGRALKHSEKRELSEEQRAQLELLRAETEKAFLEG